MKNILISKENLEIILKSIVSELFDNIDSLDLSDDDKSKLQLLNNIITNGDGTKYLSNNGRYINIDVDGINDISEKLNIIYDIFNITDTDYNLPLPENISSKLNILKTDGDGTKALTDTGTYEDISDALITPLTDEEIINLIDEINSII